MLEGKLPVGHLLEGKLHIRINVIRFLKVGGKAPCSRGNMLEGKLHKFIGYRESSIVESSYQKIGWRESSCSKSICWRESSMFYELMLYVGGKAPY